MIDEKKLIAEIREKIYPEKFGERCNSLDVIYAILQLIDEQPKVNEWIPCSENLPDPYESVLVTAKMEGDSHSLTYQGARTGCAFELSGVKNPEEYIVTAWQPEPEPWEGEA